MDTGFCAELWEPACRCERKRHKGDNPRPKVLMRQAGAGGVAELVEIESGVVSGMSTQTIRR